MRSRAVSHSKSCWAKCAPSVNNSTEVIDYSLLGTPGWTGELVSSLSPTEPPTPVPLNQSREDVLMFSSAEMFINKNQIGEVKRDEDVCVRRHAGSFELHDSLLFQ